MLEFDSISVSSYEAASLAPQLTEKSAAGWQVVSIVSAGSSVTAYLSREAQATDSGNSDDTDAYGAFAGSDNGESVAVDDAAVQPGTVIDEPVVSPVIDEAGYSGAVEVPAIDEPVVDTPVLPSEPARSWEPQPEPATSHTESSLADDVAALASQIRTDEPAASDQGTGWGASSAAAESVEPTAAEQYTQAAEQSAQATQATQASGAQSSAATAPAGWYADPSTRFELRYWDGTQWTEHVSRAGQQYTDPPVA